MPDTLHPDAPEQRTIDVDVADVDTRGRTLYGYAAVYGAESADLGGFTERIAAGAFAEVLRTSPDVRGLLNHDVSQILGRTRSGTLRLFDEARGLRFELDLPDSPLGENVREAVRRGDIDGASFRFKVGRDSWLDRTRTIEQVAELQDVTVATIGAYPSASVELRTRPDHHASDASGATAEGSAVPDENEGGLRLEDRAATTDGPDLEARVVDQLRSVRPGEARSLTVSVAEPIEPPELSSYLFDRLRPASIALASGLTVHPTTAREVHWPQLVSDVDPSWVASGEEVPEGAPGLVALTAEPKVLAHRVQIENEVLDDSTPSAQAIIDGHLAAMLALKLDRSIFEGNQAADPKSIKGLKYQTGIQTIAYGGANGAPIADYSPIIRAVGKLRSANVPGPYAVACHPDLLTELELLTETDGSRVQLGAPASVPTFFTSSQLATNEAAGTSTDARSVYVYAPAEFVLVDRQQAAIELDRSRLFHMRSSEMLGSLRVDLLVPNPTAVVRITGVRPPA